MSIYPILPILDDAVESVDVFTEVKNAIRSGGQDVWDQIEPYLLGHKTLGNSVLDGQAALVILIEHDQDHRDGALSHILTSGVMDSYKLQKVLRRVLRSYKFTMKGDLITGRVAITAESSSED